MRVYISGKIGEMTISRATRRRFDAAEEMLQGMFPADPVVNPASEAFQEAMDVAFSVNGRFENGDVQLSRTNGQIQIEVKHGLDYAARIYFITVEKALTQRIIGGEFVKQCRLDPEGNMVYEEN